MSGADDWPRRARLIGSGVVVATVAAVVVSMVRNGAGLDRRYLAVSWQLVDLPVLRDDPVGSVWYLHTQPPLFNLVVGAVLRWAPGAPIGTLVVLYVACLVATGLLLVDLLGRWGVHPVLGGVAASAALITPSALRTIVLGNYEVPLATLATLALWLIQRHLTRPRPATFVALSGTLTALVMVRSLFHPVWLAAVLVLVALARPVGRRALLAGVAVPVLVVGGWMAKNQVLFDEPTLSSWVGFNLQRGVTAPMDRDAVEAAVADGAVTPLATDVPWQSIDHYPVACPDEDRHPAVARADKTDVPVPVANFNATCYLPLYRESGDNAAAMVRREPGAYLRSREDALLLAFRLDPIGRDDPASTFAGPRDPHRTWMDAVGSVALLPVGATVSMEGWNVPLLGWAELPVEVSLTLALGFVVVCARATLALARLVRAGWRDRQEGWAAREVTWVVLGSMVALMVLGAGLVELGENDRFRATVDPLLIVGPLALVGRRVTARVTRARSGRPADDAPAALEPAGPRDRRP